MLYYSKQKIEKILEENGYTRHNTYWIFKSLDELKDDNLNIYLVAMVHWIAISTLVYLAMWILWK